jgi:NADPH2:quinone reductase
MTVSRSTNDRASEQKQGNWIFPPWRWGVSDAPPRFSVQPYSESMNNAMRIVAMEGFGGTDVLRVTEAKRPKPGAGELLIRVAAAGLNRADILQRQGHYPPPPGASEVLGMEVSGTVVERGPGAEERWQIGDAVCALVPGGGYAEFCVAHTGCCLPVPAGVTLEQAAALPEAAMTVWANVFATDARNTPRLFAGERFLMQGGTSGIGVMAIQAARARGAHVAATAGSEEKCRFLREQGCERAWNYREQDWAAGAAEWAARSGGVDVILDMVAGDYFAKHVELLGVGGRLIHIATAHGAEVHLDLRKVMRKRLTVTGSTLRSRPVEEKRRLRDAVEAELWPLIAQGKVRVVVDRALPMADAGEAQRRMESSAHIGKILLRMA